MNLFNVFRRFALAAASAGLLGLAACGDGLEREVRAETQGPRARLLRIDDAELKSRVAEALTADRQLQADAITVTVKKGEVTLAGVVPPEQIMRADEIARRISGVALVINALRSATPAS